MGSSPISGTMPNYEIRTKDGNTTVIKADHVYRDNYNKAIKLTRNVESKKMFFIFSNYPKECIVAIINDVDNVESIIDEDSIIG